MNKPLIDIDRKFRGEIEGLRTIAALLVAIYHIWLYRVSGGVDVFFVISGFLITTSIISTINRTGEFHFWPYVSKLMKRLFPGLFFILGIVIILGFFFLPGSIHEKTIREVIASMLYLQNWLLAFTNTDYLDANQMKTPVEHFWALSIQGQFYIIWFIVFTIILWILKKFQVKNARKLINIFLGTLFVISLIFSIYLTSVNQPFAYFITFTRIWEFALGGLLCVNLSLIKVHNVVATVLGWVGLICLILTGILFDVSRMFPGYIALWPMTSVLFILISSNSELKYGVKRFLALPFMVKIGGISFGIYLWHWVLLQYYRYNISETVGVIEGIGIILLSILLSSLMTRFIEKPIRMVADNKLAFKRLGILGSITVLFISSYLFVDYLEIKKLKEPFDISVYPGAMANFEKNNDVKLRPAYFIAFQDEPISSAERKVTRMNKTELEIGEYGKTKNYEGTIALIGGSTTEHWLGGVIRAAENLNYRVLILSRYATKFSAGYKEEDQKYIWNQNVLNYLKNADVDLVISQATSADTANESVHQNIIKQLQYVKDQYGIEILALRDSPRYSFNVLEKLEIRGEEETKKLMNAENSQKDEKFWRKFVKENKSMYKLDLTNYFQVDGQFVPIKGNVVIYRDHKHLTNTFSESFAPVLEKEIDKIFKEMKKK